MSCLTRVRENTMTAIQQVQKRIAEIERIPDDAPFTGTDYKRLLREIARLEYMVATVDDHLCTMLRATQTCLKVENTPFNALLLAAKLDEAASR